MLLGKWDYENFKRISSNKGTTLGCDLWVLIKSINLFSSCGVETHQCRITLILYILRYKSVREAAIRNNKFSIQSNVHRLALQHWELNTVWFHWTSTFRKGSQG